MTTSDPSAGHSPRKRVHILLVEDHGDTLSVFTRVLRHLGYEVTEAATRAAAAEALAREHFDVALVDLGLPDGSGHELMPLLAAAGVKAIAVSGYGMEADLQRSQEMGFAAHLVKPVDLKGVQDMMQRVLEGGTQWRAQERPAPARRGGGEDAGRTRPSFLNPEP